MGRRSGYKRYSADSLFRKTCLLGQMHGDDAISSDNFNLAAKSWFDPISSAQLAYPTLV